jgi:hypothetical protein
MNPPGIHSGQIRMQMTPIAQIAQINASSHLRSSAPSASNSASNSHRKTKNAPN